MAERSRKLLVNLLRIGVAIAALAWVGYRVVSEGWEDRLRTPDGDVLKGWAFREPGKAPGVAPIDRFRALDGRVFDIPPDPEDKSIAPDFTPGFPTVLKRTRLRYLLIAFAAYPLVIIISARRWQWLLATHGLDPGYPEALRLTWTGILANHVLPGATGGDLLKGWMIYRRTPGKRLSAVMTVLIDRVLGLVCLLLIGAVALMIVSRSREMAAAQAFIAAVLGVAVGGSFVYFSARLRRLLFVDALIGLLPFQKQVRALDDSVFHYRHHIPVLLRSVAISMLIHGTTIFCVWMLGRALGLSIDLLSHAVFLPVIFTAGAVIPAPAGLGVLEGLFMQCYSLPGVGGTPSAAVALCLLYRLMQLVASLPGAWPLYLEMSHGVPNLTADAPEPAFAEELVKDAANQPTVR